MSVVNKLQMHFKRKLINTRLSLLAQFSMCDINKLFKWSELSETLT